VNTYKKPWANYDINTYYKTYCVYIVSTTSLYYTLVRACYACWVLFISVILLNYLPQKCLSLTTSKLLPMALFLCPAWVFHSDFFVSELYNGGIHCHLLWLLILIVHFLCMWMLLNSTVITALIIVITANFITLLLLFCCIVFCCCIALLSVYLFL